MRIEIIRQMDNVTRKQFIFWFDDSRSTLWVDEYNLFKKETPRHKYKIVQQYKRIASRSDLNNLTTEDVPLDEEIREEAIQSLVARIKVDFWSRS